MASLIGKDLLTVIETMVGVVLGVVGGYLGLGLIAAIALHLRGLRAIDPGVAGAGWLFRVLVTPGILALWPVLCLRWSRARNGGVTPAAVDRPLGARAIRDLHRRLSWILLIVVPAAATAALALRPGDPSRGVARAVAAASPAPLPRLVLDEPAPFGPRPLSLRVRRDGTRGQLEIEVSGDLGLPAPALLWEAVEGGPPRFLARIGAPGLHRIEVDPGMLDAGGRLVLYALGHGEAVESYELAPGSPRGVAR